MIADVVSMPPLALIAGGLATRLGSLTATCPKSMIPIAGEPFIAHQLRLVRAQGVRRIVICAGHLWEQIRDFVGDGSVFDLFVDYSLDGKIKLGTGGAIKKALPKLGQEFFVMYGDSYLPTQFAPIVEYFGGTRQQGLMTVYKNQGQWDASNVVFQNGEILIYDKQKKSADMAYIDYGLGVFRQEAFSSYEENEPCDLADVYKNLLSQRQLAGYEITERFYEIGSLNGIQETENLLSKGQIYERN